MIPFNKGLFKAPKYSSFELHHDNKMSFGIGDLIPAYWNIMFPGDRFRTDVGFLARFAPMLAPVMQRFDLTVDWHFVPMRLILGERKSEEFFNLHNPDNPGHLPRFNALSYVTEIGRKNLLDYLGYPQFDNAFDAFTRAIRDGRGTVESSSNISSAPLSVLVNTSPSSPSSTGEIAEYTLFDNGWTIENPIGDGLPSAGYNALTPIKPLLYWYADNVSLLNLAKSSRWSIGEIANYVGEKNTSSIIRDYYSYLLGLLFSNFNPDNFSAWPKFIQFFYTLYEHDGGSGSSNSPFEYNDLPLRAYWRIVFDWYVDNTLFSTSTGNIYGEKVIDNSFDFNRRYLNVSSWDDSQVHEFDLFRPYKRNFAKDYFTSSFVSPQAGSDVQIPQNGTIAELRQANWMQKLKERLAWIGPRYKDIAKGIFNVDSSDARLDRVEVLSRNVSPLDIQTVVQTSQGQINNDLQAALGNLGGMSNTKGGAFGCDYLAEEHGIIMCLVSVRPKVAYQNAVRRELFKYRPYSFLWPQFAQLGEQEVLNREVYLDYDKNFAPASSSDVNNSLNGVFGWQRRYGEYMFSFDEVHGEFRRSMDYWHDSRNFNTTPSLSQDFLEISPEVNDLNRIFAVVDDENPIYFYSYFDIESVRPLPRYINYDL